MIIGNFKKTGSDYAGSIHTFGAFLDNVTIRKVHATGNDPDFIIEAEGCELGAAWEKTSKDDKPYLSVSFSGPFVTGKVYTALVQSKEPLIHSLLWSKLRKRDDASE